MPRQFADPIAMQNRLFAELSRMFGKEVPLYDRSLLVNHASNRTVCDLLAQMHLGFSISDEQLDRTSGERHGAIRIGREDEYRWVARFFACFAMEPHNFYDMTIVGTKSQPVIATAFRSLVHPQHRVFTSLLRTDYFDPDTRRRLDALLATRAVFTPRAKELIEKREQHGGLSSDDAEALIREGHEHIFKWTGQAHDHALYKHLCDAQFKIAADIACFRAHHLNHLTPNTFDIDLYTTSMKFCLGGGELDEAGFVRRATRALDRLARDADRDYLRLHFKHLGRRDIAAFKPAAVRRNAIGTLVDTLRDRLRKPDLQLSKLPHAGFKDTTEGPPTGVPVLLRQDAYKALTEPVRFTNADGSSVDSTHTARFGEIEQRFYATTTTGRALYDRCLASAEAACKDIKPSQDPEQYEQTYASAFKAFPTKLAALVEQGLVYARYEATDAGLAAAAAGRVDTTDLHDLVRRGLADYEGLRYEDFLPVSAAGIFASNLAQYGTKSTAAVKPTYSQKMLEDILGKPIVDSDAVYRGLQAESVLRLYRDLGVLGLVGPAARRELEQAVGSLPKDAAERFTERAVLAARA